MDANYNSSLNKFVEAQEPIYATALKELQQGLKSTHWIWFIFPQIDGLGHSTTAKYYAIKDKNEASDYLNHPILGPRLLECTQAMLDVEGKSANEILGYPDDLKFCSSMTLFETVAEKHSLFSQALEKYYEGKRDERTLEIMKST